MDASGIGNLLHRERLDVRGAIPKEILRAGDNRLGDVDQGPATLRDGLDQPPGPLHSTSDVFRNFLLHLRLFENRRTCGGNSKIW